MQFRSSKNAHSLAVVALVDKPACGLLFACVARELAQREFGAYSLTLTLLVLGALLVRFGLEILDSFVRSTFYRPIVAPLGRGHQLYVPLVTEGP